MKGLKAVKQPKFNTALDFLSMTEMSLDMNLALYKKAQEGSKEETRLMKRISSLYKAIQELS